MFGFNSMFYTYPMFNSFGFGMPFWGGGCCRCQQNSFSQGFGFALGLGTAGIVGNLLNKIC